VNERAGELGTPSNVKHRAIQPGHIKPSPGNVNAEEGPGLLLNRRCLQRLFDSGFFGGIESFNMQRLHK
jgi:hypothetical protein